MSELSGNQEAVTVSAHVLTRVLGFCEARGHAPEELCRQAGVSHALLLVKEARIPLDTVERLCTRALEVTADDFFGLHLAEDVRDGQHYDLGVLVLMASPTLGEALERFANNARYWGDGQRVSSHPSPNGLTLRCTLPGAKGEFLRHSIECALAEVTLGARALSGQPIRPQAVRFTHDSPGELSEYQRIFDAPLEFVAEHNEVVFDAVALNTRMLHANEAFLAVFEKQLEEALARLQAPARTSAAVREAARLALCRGGISLDEAAKELSVSSRTLQRRLQQEGTTFAEISESMRESMAVAYLTKGMSVSEISELLGYSETSAFHHAFRRWTGQSPLQFQKGMPVGEAQSE